MVISASDKATGGPTLYANYRRRTQNSHESTISVWHRVGGWSDGCKDSFTRNARKVCGVRAGGIGRRSVDKTLRIELCLGECTCVYVGRKHFIDGVEIFRGKIVTYRAGRKHFKSPNTLGINVHICFSDDWRVCGIEKLSSIVRGIDTKRRAPSLLPSDCIWSTSGRLIMLVSFRLEPRAWPIIVRSQLESELLDSNKKYTKVIRHYQFVLARLVEIAKHFTNKN